MSGCSRAAPRCCCLCMARPELLDGRPTWPVTVRLEPLDSQDVDSLIGPERRRGAAREDRAAAGGNPLFIAEMLAMAARHGGEVVVPPTLEGAARRPARSARPCRAARARARRDRGRGLPPGRRAGAHAGGAAGDPAARRSRPRELIHPERAQFAGEDGFRFRHLLIRDAAYDALPKAVRAELHERFAALAGAPRRARGARRDPRLPPGAGRPLQARARPAGSGPRRARR